MSGPAPIWVVGDLQGCYGPLQALLAHPDIVRDSAAQLWFAGDLVNRGPDSLASLRTVMGLGERAICVLGNHDLHLLAVAAGIKKEGKSDTLDALLAAADAPALIDWLRHRPLAHYSDGHLMVHAGILPQWNVAKTLALAGEVEAALRGPDWQAALSDMYGNKPVYWDDSHTGAKRMRVIINALTRMRMCTPGGYMDFSHKGPPETTDTLMPWFDVPGRASGDTTVVFGHWSALGLMIRPDAICLDTGCVWGRELTAVRLHDHKVIQISCRAANGRVVDSQGADFAAVQRQAPDTWTQER